MSLVTLDEARRKDADARSEALNDAENLGSIARSAVALGAGVMKFFRRKPAA